MEFKGGVIIVGSLLWDNKPKREDWRQSYLQSTDNKIPVPVKIRYGRKSSTRKDTYTIIYSNHPSTKFGQAFILPFCNLIKNAEELKNQAFALANAEGLKANQKPTLNKSWGTVGLLMNPNIDNKDKENADIIRDNWAALYKQYDFDNTNYVIESEPSVIDKKGFLQVEWTKEMNGFDFLIATPVVPKPKRTLTAKEIAQRMTDKQYTKYFKNNIIYHIITFQDEKILNEMN